MANILKIKITGLIISVVLLISACSTISVSENYDTSYEFSKLNTFNFIRSEDKKNALTIKQIQKELKTQLAAKGLRFVTTNPDFQVAVYGGSEDKVSMKSTYSGYNYGGWYRGGYGGGISSGSTIDVYEYKEGTLVLDFIDGKSKQVVFQSIATKELARNPSMETRLKNIKNIVTKAIRDFPPAPKKK